MPTQIDRSQATFGEGGLTGRIVKSDGDVTVSSTTFGAVAGMSGTITLARPAKLMVLVNAYGRASLLQTLHLTIAVDGVNFGGAGGLSSIEGNIAGSLCMAGLTDVLSAGSHTIELRARVSGLTGTIFASLASGLLVASAFIIGEDAP